MNKINQYVSTYQKDYTWPYVSSICRIQPPIKPIIIKDCTCTDSRQERKELLDGKLEKYPDWSRMGPMGRLLEPKIYETKIERAPKADITRLDQLTSICLKEGYPGLYEALEKSFPKEPITRMDIDLMKTTYQKDYSDPAARMTQRDMALTVLDTNDQCLPCSMPTKIIIKTDCSPYCRFSSSRYNGNASVGKRDRKQKIGLKREKKCEDIEKRQISLPSWRSEYQDSINKIGHAIMKVKLHHAKKKALPIQYQYSTTSSRTY
ncbi:PREDICTED: uncharacterized protein LOC108760707 isoform X2 [Trachymyrmex cornetzi]|uniref:uncharacterized protein LOC108760707 isoform X2 n=1 Tax=Trachymyrmex cornetzi TaxID=471704 RepID=UPI00084F0541|nr:PREDICTED: uncharacterized protein LOC108760707 isoform X2 [Trachymyrmex cornetzi]